MKMALVYFIKPKGKRGPIKIGCSNSPATRLEALGAWSPWPLEVIGHLPGNLSDEQFLHQCFAADHLHREWFKYSPRLMDTIRRVLDAQSLDCVRGEIAPAGNIRRKTVRRPRSSEERLRFSYSSRVRHCETRMRKNHEAWHAPEDVCLILHRWRNHSYWDAAKKEYARHKAQTPTSAELARVDEYLADPAAHSVVPNWSRRKDSICIPVFGQSAEAFI